MLENEDGRVPDTPSTWIWVAAIGVATSAVSFLLRPPLHSLVLGFGLLAILAGAVLAGFRWWQTRSK